MRAMKYFVAAIVAGCMSVVGMHDASALSVEVREGDLRATVTGIAKAEGVGIVGTDSLHGTVTASFSVDTPEEALRILGGIRNFSVRKEGGVYVVEGAKEDDHVREPFVLSPVHARAEDIVPLLRTVVAPERISIRSDTNRIVAYVTPRERRMIARLAAEADAEPAQVHLSVTVMALSGSYLRERGLSWTWLGLTGHGTDETGTYGAIRFGKAEGGDSYKFFFAPELHATETEGKAVVIARPSVLTVSGEQSKILIGDRIPVLTEQRENGTVSTTVRYEEAGIRLICRPVVTGDGYIDADISAEVSTPSLVSEMKAYRITTREAETRVRLKRGEVLVIGGLMDLREQNAYRAVPFLSRIPLIGQLFKYARKEKDTVELVILVKADIAERAGHKGEEDGTDSHHRFE